ncbi:hypothetical protein KCU93_g4349, partial [Aureobasidium melanogenum]
MSNDNENEGERERWSGATGIHADHAYSLIRTRDDWPTNPVTLNRDSISERLAREYSHFPQLAKEKRRDIVTKVLKHALWKNDIQEDVYRQYHESSKSERDRITMPPIVENPSRPWESLDEAMRRLNRGSLRESGRAPRVVRSGESDPFHNVVHPEPRHRPSDIRRADDDASRSGKSTSARNKVSSFLNPSTFRSSGSDAGSTGSKRAKVAAVGQAVKKRASDAFRKSKSSQKDAKDGGSHTVSTKSSLSLFHKDAAKSKPESRPSSSSRPGAMGPPDMPAMPAMPRLPGLSEPSPWPQEMPSHLSTWHQEMPARPSSSQQRQEQVGSASSRHSNRPSVVSVSSGLSSPLASSRPGSQDPTKKPSSHARRPSASSHRPSVSSSHRPSVSSPNRPSQTTHADDDDDPYRPPTPGLGPPATRPSASHGRHTSISSHRPSVSSSHRPENVFDAARRENDERARGTGHGARDRHGSRTQDRHRPDWQQQDTSTMQADLSSRHTPVSSVLGAIRNITTRKSGTSAAQVVTAAQQQQRDDAQAALDKNPTSASSRLAWSVAGPAADPKKTVWACPVPNCNYTKDPKQTEYNFRQHMMRDRNHQKYFASQNRNVCQHGCDRTGFYDQQSLILHYSGSTCQGGKKLDKNAMTGKKCKYDACSVKPTTPSNMNGWVQHWKQHAEDAFRDSSYDHRWSCPLCETSYPNELLLFRHLAQDLSAGRSSDHAKAMLSKDLWNQPLPTKVIP